MPAPFFSVIVLVTRKKKEKKEKKKRGKDAVLVEASRERERAAFKYSSTFPTFSNRSSVYDVWAFARINARKRL